MSVAEVDLQRISGGSAVVDAAIAAFVPGL
jgi:hypothetical protein